MAGKIKGLTVEIGGDTTKLGKALENVNKKSRDLSGELGQVNRLLKMDPGNADLVAQKQKILAEAVENTRDKLDTLKEAEKQVQAQFERGEVSEAQYRELQREIIATEQKLQSYERAAKEVAEGNDSIAQSADKAGAESEDMGGKLSKLGSIAKGFGAAIGAAVAGLTAAAEASRDYRMEMGKLDTAFTDNGFSSQAATSAYKELVGILGEYDQSVETANHLAKLTSTEKELATWTGDILPGVFATFGDSLPIEGLTEAANETAKVGQVTGPLADALNWAGISEDKFNESLAKCTSEQERQQLITDTLAKTYGSASEAYKETNADVIAANQATDNWNAAMAQVGAAVEPVITAVKNIGATLLSGLVPALQFILGNLPMILTIMAGITAAVVAFNGALILSTIQTKLAAAAQMALNVAMNANPIGLIILAITALVAAFMYLWKNSEKFRKFWKSLWKNIKSVVSAVVDWFKKLPDKIKDAIDGAVDRVKDWGSKLLTVAKKAAMLVVTGLYTIYVKIPMKIWQAIFGAIAKVVQWGTQMASKAKEAASKVLTTVASGLKSMGSKVWGAISGALSQMTKWGTQMASRAKSAASKVLSTIVSNLKKIPSRIKSIGGDVVSGLWNGISNKVAWLKGKISGFVGNVKTWLKKFFKIGSPSRLMADEIGQHLPTGIAEGIKESAAAPEKALQKVATGVIDTARNLNGVQLGQQLQANFGGATQDVGSKLDKILTALERGQILVIDGDKLVGATAGSIDKHLGQRRILAARGAI